jgi:hypothetical protein
VRIDVLEVAQGIEMKGAGFRSIKAARPPRHFCWPSRRTEPKVMIHRRRRAEVHQSCCRLPAEAGDQTQGEPGLFFGFEKSDYRNQTGTSPVGQLSRPTGPQRGGTMLRGVCLRTSPSSNAHIAPMAKIHPRAAHVGSCAHACCSCGQIQITARMLSNPFRRRA